MSTQSVVPSITPGQLAGLKKWGYPEDGVSNLTKDEAGDLLDACSRAKRRLNATEYEQFKQQEITDDAAAIEQRGFLMPSIDNNRLDELFEDLSTQEKVDEEDLRAGLTELGRSFAKNVET